MILGWIGLDFDECEPRMCAERFGKHAVGRDSGSRPYDIPWMVLDSARAKRQWDWQPTLLVEQILEDIGQHAQAHPEWLEISGSA